MYMKSLSRIEVDDSTEHASLSSEETSFKQPEQRSKKHIRFNEEVHYNTGLKPCCRSG